MLVGAGADPKETVLLSTNKERALAILMEEGPTYRADLARRLNVSRTTVTNLAKDLLTGGLVDSRSVLADAILKERLTFTDSAGLLGSMVFGPERVAVALGTLDGAVGARGGGDLGLSWTGTDRLEAATVAMRGLVVTAQASGAGQLRAVHVAVNTQCDRVTGEVLGGDASLAWRGSNPLTAIRGAFNVPVVIENTARLEGLAEYLAGTGDSPQNLVYVRLSHGVAMGQVVAGKVQSGGRGGAGEIGHVSIDPQGPTCACGNRGCLMTYVGLPALAIQIAPVLGQDADVADLVADARGGGHASRGLLEDAGVALARALSTVCNLLDPDVIVLGGELSRAGDLLVDPVVREIKRRALPLVTGRLKVMVGQCWDDVDVVTSAGLAQLRHTRQLVDSVVKQLVD